jgi:hypothetical protein
MRTRPAILVSLLTITLTGCVIAVNTRDMEDGMSDWQDRQQRNERAINRMQPGESRAAVETRLGDPDFVESFLREGSTFVVLYYRTRRMHNDGRTTKDETTPLVFVNGSLVGWGASAIAHATSK